MLQLQKNKKSDNQRLNVDWPCRAYGFLDSNVLRASEVNGVGPIADAELYAGRVATGHVESSGTLASGALGANASLLTVFGDFLTVDALLQSEAHSSMKTGN